MQVGAASNAGAAPADGWSKEIGRWPSFPLPVDWPPVWSADILLENFEEGWAAEGASRGPKPSRTSRLRRRPR